MSDYTIVWSKTPGKVIKPDSKPLLPPQKKKQRYPFSLWGEKAEADSGVIQIQEVMAL